MRVLVIIPAYNEEDSLEGVVREFEAANTGYDYIVVNDCSSDGTPEVIAENGMNRLNLAVNLGIGGGVQTGYRYALENDYDIAVQMDGDGQHDPRCLKTVVGPVETGEADLCVGSRFITKEGFQTSALRRFGIRFLSSVIKLCCKVKVNDVTSGLRACSKDLIAYYAESYAQDYPEPEAIVSAAHCGYRIKEVPVVMRERSGGVSSISPLRSAYFMLKVSAAILLCRFLMPEHGLRKIRGGRGGGE